MVYFQDSYVATINTVSWILGAIVIFLTCARIFGRTAVIHQAGWDDVFMGLATISALICSALVTAGTTYGLGIHTKEITNPNDKTEAIKYTVIAPAWSIICSSFGKLSVLTFLFRLLGVTTKKWHMIFLWGICFVMVSLNIMAIIIIVGFCRPAAAQWDPNVQGECMDPTTQAILGDTQAAYNAFMDIVVALFPPFVIKKLNMTTKMKFGLCIIMSGGLFAAACTIIKTWLISKNLANHDDITYSWAPITLWYTAEMDVIIILGNIPTLWPLFLWFTSKIKSRGGDQSYGLYQNTTSQPRHIAGSDAFELKDVSHKGSGPVTRALQEVDDLHTARTKTPDGSEGSQTEMVKQ